MKMLLTIFLVIFSISSFSMEEIKLLKISEPLYSSMEDRKDLFAKLPQEIKWIILVQLNEEDLQKFRATSQGSRQSVDALYSFFPTSLPNFWNVKDLLESLTIIENFENSFLCCVSRNKDYKLVKNYRKGIEKIVNAAQRIRFSRHFRQHDGPERIKTLAKFYKIIPATPSILRSLLSSLMQDPTGSKVVYAGSLGFSVVIIGVIVKDILEYQYQLKNSTDYVNSQSFIDNQLLYNHIDFSPSSCFTQCIKNFIWECADFKNWCNGSDVAMAAFRKAMQDLHKIMADNCSFVDFRNYSLSNMTDFYRDFLNTSFCEDNKFKTSIERIKPNSTALMSQNSNFWYCENSLKYSVWVNAGSYDAQCVTDALANKPLLLPLWIILTLVPYPFLLASLAFIYCVPL